MGTHGADWFWRGAAGGRDAAAAAKAGCAEPEAPAAPSTGVAIAAISCAISERCCCCIWAITLK
eukprot:9124473-Alexandrium_andersonii.AAC.1